MNIMHRLAHHSLTRIGSAGTARHRVGGVGVIENSSFAEILIVSAVVAAAIYYVQTTT